MFTITKIFEFESAHQLLHHPGQCKNLHGHSYKLEVTIYRQDGYLNQNMMVCDFSDLKKVISPIVKKMDHNFLNELLQTEDPTAESIIQYILNNVEWPDQILPKKIRIWETSNSYAEWNKEK